MNLSTLFTMLTLSLFILAAQSPQGDMDNDLTDADMLQSLDEQFLAVSGRVPEFAGLYYDERGLVVIALKASPEELAALESPAKAAVAEVFGEDLSEVPVRFVLARFSYQELHEWYTRLEPEVFVPGVHQFSIDEVRNRIVIGVKDLSVEPSVKALLVKAQVPLEAVIIEQVEPPRELG